MVYAIIFADILHAETCTREKTPKPLTPNRKNFRSEKTKRHADSDGQHGNYSYQRNRDFTNYRNVNANVNPGKYYIFPGIDDNSIETCNRVAMEDDSSKWIALGFSWTPTWT